MRASGDRGRGRPRVACGPREVGHASEEREEKGRGEKGGAGFAAAGHDASRWMGQRWDADRIRVSGYSGEALGIRVQGLRGVELNERQL